jgi:hypothetical protein
MRTSDRRTRLAVGFLAASLALMTVIGPAAAAKPQPVTIVSPVVLVDGGYNYGTFTRSGSDLICASGSFVDTRYVWAGMPYGSNPHGDNLQVDKTFDCGNGLIYFRLKVHGVYVGETFNWVILGGTGAYAGLHGEGQGTTVYGDPLTNTYTGSLH